MKPLIIAAALSLAACALAGCAISPPPSAADQADIATCTSQADATYDAQNYDQLSRTSQNGLLYGATPTHVFDAQRLGALHARDDQISDCLHNGNIAAGAGRAMPGTYPAPRIVTP